MPYTVYIKLAEDAGLEQKEPYRFAEVLKAATDLFEGDKARARQWLLNPVRGLGGRRPIEMLATSAGAEAVLNLIGRLEHGVAV
ncbi:hypothetical protein B5T_00558 [Alloalcanivorax dieselolei B5]|uniref:Antitoxin Xre/MbcA/ParS-like toxin-binding domain-containing protein n=1 Tax=Alcanivorax dieselolei (strain DSM 16502 / CGMCC 1.3690 / MCCC 1A00001 / B-5) TaxID=930169 RepID=K0C8D0_ALCDB|nr:antitoxin Xre/MbcA/ParS toxin-binding domain-containing protein [Alloalcanivorax dieselolei]AFT68843.1 hypothetical protein B5T_00558 [Alloalcanivorax dieselolei B5]GGK06264.1 hypothetical protein GCM10007426_38680 [Alloalcanivorax dieselolei]